MMKKLGVFLLAFLLVIGVAFNTQAAVTYLADLFGGGALIVENTRFYDWTLVSATGMATDFDAFIEVEEYSIGETNPGFVIKAKDQFTAMGERSIELIFDFKVEPVGGSPWIRGSTLYGPTFIHQGVGGGYSIGSIISDTQSTPNELGSISVFHWWPSDNQSNLDFTTFPPQPVVSAHNTININADGSMELIDWAQTFTQVPIPSALLLLGSGLVGLVGFRRKFKK